MTGTEPVAPRGRFCIIHGHFYQPPRENPWIDIVEKQASASPHHDWNERICSQCYRPNAFSRLLDSNGMIRGIYNNYRSLSFNFGPTLMRWLERMHPDVVDRIVEADRRSVAEHHGHGNAIAQVYNHIIMPLASRRDQRAQIRWAKWCFRDRFGRDPEGIWLAETAVNMATAETLVEEGIRFVILSPHQAESWRKLDDRDVGAWVSCPDGGIDTRKAYRMFLSEAARKNNSDFLDIFFFDEGLSKDASFGNLLEDANTLTAGITERFEAVSAENQAVIIATDGETFGHHKPFSDMCLAYFFHDLASTAGIIPVNFGRFLEIEPPRREVRLKNANGEGTSWSCAHGVGRWARNCGCSTGGYPGWNQEWRTPLRASLESLQQHIDREFTERLKKYEVDPWRVRDAYVPYRIAADDFGGFLSSQGFPGGLPQEEMLRIRRLLEAQKYMLFSFTSCGWFFADLGGIETIQNIAYAARATQLAFDNDSAGNLENFLALLDVARSNIAGVSGRTLFERHVAPLMRHRELICFAAVVEKILSQKVLDRIRRNGYTVSLKALGGKQVGKRRFQTHFISMINECNGEAGMYGILTIHTDDADVSGYVLPWPAVKAPSFERDNSKAWMDHPDVVCLHPDDLFQAVRSILSMRFQKDTFPDILQMYDDWAKNNRDVIKKLASLAEPLEPFLAVPLQAVLGAQFNKALRKLKTRGNEDAVFAKLLEIGRQSGRMGLSLDFTFAAAFLERALHIELLHFSRNLSQDSADRMRYLLNIVDRFEIPVAKNSLEEVFWRIMGTTVKPLYEQYVRGDKSDNKIRTRLIWLLSFARRMNFTCAEFVLE